MIRPITAEQIEAVAARRQQERAARTSATLENTPPQITNVQAFAHLGVGDVLTFRGRRFFVPPVTADQGVELLHLSVEFAVYSFAAQSIAQRMAALADQPGTDANIQVLYGLVQEHATHAEKQLRTSIRAVRLFRECVRPMGLWDRLTWRWRGNPFGNVSDVEIQELFGFFCSRRMTPPIRHPLETKT